MDDRPSACTLISASCTTSWFDWIHGELWLCPAGILRRSLGLRATLDHRNRPTIDPSNRSTRAIGADEIALVVAADRRNRWITWTEVAHATLKRGMIDHSLHVELGDGRREKFLWLRVDGGYDLLQTSLERSLPGRFTALDQPIG